MNRFLSFFIAALVFCSCERPAPKKNVGYAPFTIETMNKITPVKDQGHSSLCWIYAMLATIESDRLMIGDSVNLSPHYVARMFLRSQLGQSYLSGGKDSIRTAATAPYALALLDSFGVMPFDSYRSECNYNVLSRRLDRLTLMAARRGAGIERTLITADNIMDNCINPLPWHVYMLGAEYTPVEFAHSVCLPGDYLALTSFTHLPMNRLVRLDVPDNRQGCEFLNVPIDTLMNRICAALRSGRSVCWEGDTSEPGISFKDGTARLRPTETDLSQRMRQRMFETFRTTDDHCMELIGTARDRSGRRYFICKNSWGTANPYHGLMFMSFDYARLKTIAVVMKNNNR